MPVTRECHTCAGEVRVPVCALCVCTPPGAPVYPVLTPMACAHACICTDVRLCLRTHVCSSAFMSCGTQRDSAILRTGVLSSPQAGACWKCGLSPRAIGTERPRPQAGLPHPARSHPAGPTSKPRQAFPGVAQSRGGMGSVTCMLRGPEAKGLGSVGCEFPALQMDLVISGFPIPLS